MTMLEKIARAICESRKFECGQGCCRFTCMDQLGDPRKRGCPHALKNHGELARAAVEAIREPTKFMCDYGINAMANFPKTDPPLYPIAYQQMIDAILNEDQP